VNHIVVFIDGKYVYACTAGRAYVDGIEAGAALLGARDRVVVYVLPEDHAEMCVNQKAEEVAKVPMKEWRP
jgi:hypothetical protein